MNSPKESRIARVALSDSDTEELLVTAVGFNLYRLEESSILGEVKYHDIIETELETDGTLRLVQVAASSGLITVSWVVTEAQFDSTNLKLLLDKVITAEGNWERSLGGLLMLHLPPAKAAAIVGEFNAFFGDVAGSS